MLPALLALALAAAAPAGASEDTWIGKYKPQRGQWEVGTFAGLMIIGARHDFYDPDTAPQVRLGKLGPIAGLRGGYYPLSFLGLETEGYGMWTRVPVRNNEPAFVYALRAQGVLQLPLYRVVPFVMGGYGIAGVRSPMDAVGNDVDPAGHYGAGLKLMADARFAIRLEGRHMMTPARQRRLQVANHFSILLGVSIRLGPQPHEGARPRAAEREEVDTGMGDGDGDGVRDGADACPTLSGTFPSGCPAMDHDKDGIPDSIDACPTEAAEGDGCPERDTDGDGRPDAQDRCPWEAGADPRGCVPPDFDADGLPDDSDECPAQAGNRPSGCPDADGDGIAGSDDDCPTQPETINGINDADGCPD